MIVTYSSLPYQIGDHLKAYRGPHWHHAIYIGDGQVLHYCGPSGRKKDCEVRTDSFEDFAKDSEVEVVQYDPDTADQPHIVLQRAFNRLGERRFNLLTNNCESLARACKTGIPSSGQVVAGVCAFGVVSLAVYFAFRR